MTEPLIPDAAYDAGDHEAARYVASSDAPDVAADVIRAAAPLIVVAELQALVDILAEKREEMCTEDHRPLRSSALGTAIDLLRTRIDELSAVTS